MRTCAWIVLCAGAASSGGATDPPLDYGAHPVVATDPLCQGNWLGSGPQAAVDGIRGPSAMPFAYRSYVRKSRLDPYERKGHQDVGGAGWTDPWSPDCSETGAPTAGLPARLELDYGAPVAVAKLAVYFPRQGNGDTYLSPTAVAAFLETVEVLRSSDGVRWESAVRIDRLPWTSPQVIEIPEPKPARRYILSVESMAPGNDALRIYEVETYLDANARVAVEPVLPPAPPPAAELEPGGASAGEFGVPAGRCGFRLEPAGLSLDLRRRSASARLSLMARPDAREPEGGWAAVRGDRATFAARVPGGQARLSIEGDALGLRLEAGMPPPSVGSARRFLYLRIQVPEARVRFVPAHVWSREPVRSAWPGWWLPTCLAAIETPAGTVALAPDSDRCRIGVDGDVLTICLFPDAGAASARILLVEGGWWDAYRRVVEDVDLFRGVVQARPSVEAASGVLRWLLLDKNWSEAWGMQRSFPAAEDFYPEKEYFFIFYGQPYVVPALWQRWLLAGDSRARRRLDRVLDFLLDSPARVKTGPMAGGYYSTLAGSRKDHKLIDQAYNPWMTTQATGAALWTLLHHRALLASEASSLGGPGAASPAPEAGERLDRAIAETAECLLRIQRPDGGWAFAHRERDGSVPSGDFASAGSIWNVHALWLAGAALGRASWSEAARRGKDWWIRTFLEKHLYRGYWEDSNFKEVIYPTVEGYECALAVPAFLEMGDEPRALEAARDLATWVQTRAASYRDAGTSLGHVPEQLTWPGDAYLAPQVALAFQEIARRTKDPFWAPYASIAKTFARWCEPETGAMFFPIEAAAFVPLDRGPLTRTYWGDWGGAHCASRTIWWLVDEVNDRSGGRIRVDRDRLAGTILGEPCSAWLPDDAPSPEVATGDQVNWMGYESRSAWRLAVLNDDPSSPARIGLRGADRLDGPAVATVTWVIEGRPGTADGEGAGAGPAPGDEPAPPGTRPAGPSTWSPATGPLTLPPRSLAILTWPPLLGR